MSATGAAAAAFTAHRTQKLLARVRPAGAARSRASSGRLKRQRLYHGDASDDGLSARPLTAWSETRRLRIADRKAWQERQGRATRPQRFNALLTATSPPMGAAQEGWHRRKSARVIETEVANRP
jgi:hypothetical protein